MNIIARPSPNYSARVPGDPVDMIVLHCTVGSFESALNWMRNPAPPNPETGKPDPSLAVSSHYEISEAGGIVQLVDEERVAWHAGRSIWAPLNRVNINRYSIGIELANSNQQGDDYPPPQFNAAAQLIDNICKRRNIPRDKIHIVRHMDIAPRRKTDPQFFQYDALFAALGASEPLYDDQTYFITPTVINVRQGPATGFPVAAKMYRGQRVYIDTIVEGESLFGTTKWAHMARRPPEQFDMGFIKLELLRKG